MADILECHTNMHIILIQNRKHTIIIYKASGPRCFDGNGKWQSGGAGHKNHVSEVAGTCWLNIIFLYYYKRTLNIHTNITSHATQILQSY